MDYRSWHDVDLDSNLGTIAENTRRAPKFGTTRRSAPKSFALRAAALAKNRRADAHQRRAFLDRNSEIVRHPHRKERKFQIEFLFERVTQFAQLHKKCSRGFCFPGERRNYHQTLDRQSRQCEQRFHFRVYGFRLETKFTPLTRHVHFNQDPWMHSVLVRDPVYLLSQRKRIDVMD